MVRDPDRNGSTRQDRPPNLLKDSTSGPTTAVRLMFGSATASGSPWHSEWSPPPPQGSSKFNDRPTLNRDHPSRGSERRTGGPQAHPVSHPRRTLYAWDAINTFGRRAPGIAHRSPSFSGPRVWVPGTSPERLLAHDGSGRGWKRGEYPRRRSPDHRLHWIKIQTFIDVSSAPRIGGGFATVVVDDRSQSHDLVPADAIRR